MKADYKILITGGNGFLGSNLFQILSSRRLEVGRLDINGECEYSGCDATDFDSMESVIHKFQPDCIIHCAARKNLPDCEEHKEESFKSNVLSTEHLVQLSKIYNFKIVYISSDVVFDGEKGNYKIDDAINPINWYGKTKAFSELLIKSSSDYAICRTALVIGKLDNIYKNYLKEEITNPVLVNQTLLPQYIYTRLKSSLPVELPSIYISNPTPVELLSESILNIIVNNKVGVFHTSGIDSVSRIDFANIIADSFGFDLNLIKANNENVSKLRPKNISFDVTSTYESLNINKSNWGLKSYLGDLSLYE